ncbi:MAG: hypothetical protein COV79_01490 [Parcubacteria group bacterium CG11_big_fil_rev_8_21_14_0_20_41_14]|uniref:Uncharacterized protein n=1 Tax=Candidatus Beckwithbacteria bacterium CG_4_9_14_0_2_um_filter_47_11 TaxID=1974494 RepID=A0A2M8G441_9BACT|nr:MAG: hypothetical protein COV79_01490 [Parcubacteria group bacterium CG11_big_fil_rev_8_21_14_0_20_41_14]PJC66406.1 MAG: hypothetical protein CO018_02105 [Candidatus Beckwithbacteria bacterium CG_4_9_14_0_2_um_filter_47_11]
MYALVNAISVHPKTPEHLRRYLFDHVDTSTADGLTLFDVLEMFGHNGQPFRQLAKIVVQSLQTTPDYESLQELIFSLSQKDEAKHWVTMFRQGKNKPSLKELLP